MSSLGLPSTYRTVDTDLELDVQTPQTGDHAQRQNPAIRGESQAKRYEVVCLDDPQAMEQYIPQWETLAQNAIEPNIFYEYWALLPALRLYGNPSVKVAFVLERDPNAGNRVLLIGVFPLEFAKRFRWLPLACVHLWKHPHCYLANPLIAKGAESECWGAIFAWLKACNSCGPLFAMNTLSGDGPVLRSLLAYTFSGQVPMYVSEMYGRAMLEMGTSGEEYLRANMGGDHRRGYAKKKRRLAEKGKLEVCQLGPDDDLEKWIADFLAVEASGWKGKVATAMACCETDRQFLKTISQEAFARRRLMMLTLKLDGRAIAVHHGIFAGQGAFALKIAYDEKLGQYSPGLLLEIEALHEFHKQRLCRWVDCCSAVDSVVMKRIWKQQRIITSVVCPTGKFGGRFLVAALPLGRYLWGKVRRVFAKKAINVPAT